MIIDIHTHVSAMTAPRGFMSRKLMNSAAFRFMRWRLGLVGEDRGTEDALLGLLLTTMKQAETDAAVVLAFDAVYGRPADAIPTHPWERLAHHCYSAAQTHWAEPHARAWRDRNWMRRDTLIKRAMVIRS